MGDLFIGLVTHPRTQYPHSAQDQGLFTQLSRTLAEQDVILNGQIESRNLLSSQHTFTEFELSASRRHLLTLRKKWSLYCQQDPIRRQRQRLALLRTRGTEPRSQEEARRLLNIEMAHVELMNQAVAQDAEFSLILEDDAASSSVHDLASDITELIRRKDSPFMAQISSSFSPRTLGIQNLIGAVERQWSNGGQEFRLLKPATNTVCATIYRRDFLTTLLDAWSHQQHIPIVPVDWRLNEILIALESARQLPKGYSSIVFPGPIVQQSLGS